MSPPIYMRLVETLMNEYGYDYDSTPGVIEKYDLMFDPGNIVNVPEGPFNDDQFATGGRVGLQTGGLPIRTGDFRDSNNDGIDDRDQPEIFGGSGIGNIKKFSPETYEQILSRIEQTYPTDSQQTISRPGPQAEALQSVFGPTLAQFLGRPMSPTGGTNVFGEQFGSFLPQQQAQNRLQQLQIEQALGQAGLGRAQFDPRTGGLTGVTGTGTGVAGFQPFLDQATTTADRASQEAVAGQDAGLQQLQNAATQANLAGLAAIAGQDSGARGVGAAQNIADRIEAQAVAGQDRAQPFLDRAAQLSAPGAFEEFMSPYQQEGLDTTRPVSYTHLTLPTKRIV